MDVVAEAAAAAGLAPAAQEGLQGGFEGVEVEALQVGLGQAAEVGGAPQPELVLVGAAADQAQFSHVGPGTAIGAAGDAHQDRSLDLQLAQLAFQPFQDRRQAPLRLGHG